MATTPKFPPEIYATFTGQIDAAALQRITTAFDIAMTNGVRTVHLFFHSIGGFVGDGLAMYSYFKAVPFDLTLYNPGIVASIGVIAYLGALHRATSPHAVFMIHRTQCNIPPGTPAIRAQTIVNSALLDDQRTEATLKDRLVLPADKWKQFESDDLHFSAEEAVKYGIAEKIADFSPPPGTQIYNI